MTAESILIVEKEETIRDFVSAVLTSANYSCRQAASGREALALLDSGEEFSLMLSDLTMPDMDGTVLLESSKERFPDMPVIMVTAVADVCVALGAIRNGAYDYLLKPFEREQLLPTVRRALEYRRLKLENRNYQTNLEALVTDRTAQLRQALDRLERAYDITMDSLGNALKLKNAEAHAHSKRVTAYTIGIARAMGLGANQIRIIARGAFLHDIGKLAVPDDILKKPGPLDAPQSKIMRQHPDQGYEILKGIPFLAEPAEIVYAHHEKFDGTGYPQRLKGEKIPLGARILAIANALDSMTSDWAYRARSPLPAAREEIMRWSGRQFDPAIVKVFSNMPEHGWTDLRRDADAPGNPSVYQ